MVSIIIVNYNGITHLDACVSSVLSQTYQDYEVILVDNNSTDDSLNYARTQFPDLIFVESTENEGYGGGIRRGLEYASGRHIAPLNVDTQVATDWLSGMVRFLDENPMAGAITPKILLFDDRNRINALGINIHITGLSFCRKLYRKDNGLNEPQKVSGVSGCSYLIRRQILDRINEVVSEWPMTYDDVIISWLINLMGYEIYCIPEAVVYHKYSLQMNPHKFSLLERERHSFLLACLKPFTFFVYFPIFAAVEFLILTYSLLKGKRYIQSKAKAIAYVLRRSRDITKKRRKYEELREISDFELFRRLRLNLEWDQLLSIMR